jgi:hypothetical protein
MTKTHRVKYVSAWGEDGKFIYPTEYEERLKGALVLMHFTLKHRDIVDSDGRRVQRLETEVETIFVLESPRRGQIRESNPG